MSFDPFLSDYRPRGNSGVVFGEVLGKKSIADLQDLLTSVRYRMTQMATALGQVDPSKVKDPKAFAALMVDAGNLKNRVSRADAGAAAAVANTPSVTAAVTPAQNWYDALVKAMKQGYPPAAAQIQRGDYDDIVNRIWQVGGVRVDTSQMPQPRTADPDQRFMQYTLPVQQGVDAAVAAAKAAAEELEREKKDAGKAFDLLHWMREHETELLVVGGVISALWLYSIFMVWKAAVPFVLPVARRAALSAVPGGALIA
jgi:hypothetical protein